MADPAVLTDPAPPVAVARPSDPANWYAPRAVAAPSPANATLDHPSAADSTGSGAVFSQQMCEVQLLLDFLSGSPARRLPDPAAAVAAGLPRDWIEQICRISWPPAGTLAAQADEEALLVKVKDYLNALAAPANGASVAFTLLVAQEDDAADAPAASESQNDAAQAGRAFSRNGLARTAFPGLVGKSRSFRAGMLSIGIGLTIWLILTCALSWYAALGNARLSQLNAAEVALTTARAKVSAPTAVSTDAAPPQGRAALATGGIACVAGTACGDVATAEAIVKAARAGVGTWLAFRPEADGALIANDATSALSVIGSGILPVMYGILGAAAAVLRLLSGRMRLSLLMPRDLTLALQQLALGAVVGACIGLFVTSDGAGVLGTVSLSSSALSFVAGFGVDAVFATLEALIARLFNTSAPTPATDLKA